MATRKNSLRWANQSRSAKGKLTSSVLAWLPPTEWWKIYEDGRNFGGKDSVAVTLNVLNDEAMFHGKDTRLNLELNLGDPVKQDSLNTCKQT